MKQVDKEKYNKIIDEAYENYLNSSECQATVTYLPSPYSKKEFLSEIKTNPRFSEKWDLRIEEKILKLNEVPTKVLKVRYGDESCFAVEVY